MEPGAGAQLLGERHIKTRRARPNRCAEPLAFADQLVEISRRIGKALKVVGDREVLHDIAFPGADDPAIGLDPFGHAASSRLARLPNQPGIAGLGAPAAATLSLPNSYKWHATRWPAEISRNG